jgi:FixJ family two-component response regulator
MEQGNSDAPLFMRSSSVMQPGEVVYLVDDDTAFRESIACLLGAYEMEVISFDSAVSFLRYKRLDTAACLVLDLQLPEMNGLDLQERLGNSALPIIFITGHGDISSSVRAMKAGAIEFLTKPVDREALIIAVRTALSCDRDNRVRQAELAELRNRYSLLSPREREVLPLVVAGYLNKQSAAILGITEITLQNHRGQIMRKMAAASFAELVRMCGALGIPEAAQRPAGHRPIPSPPPRDVAE